MSSATPDKLHLFDHPVSSYAQKVRIALREKGLEFTKETPASFGGQENAAFTAANPRKEVPALVVTPSDPNKAPFGVFDSTVILMYLEDAYPEQKSLLPRDPRLRAEARMIEEVCDTHYEANNWAIAEIKWFRRAEGAEAEALLEKAEKLTAQFQAWLAEKLGDKPFFAGDEFTYADIAAAAVVNRSVVNGYGPEKGSPLQKWHERVSAIPSVQETFAEMVAAAKVFSATAGNLFKPHSGSRREYRDHRLEWMIKNGGLNIVEQGLKDDNIRFSWP
ncbi:glutathione S-transferase [Dissoconium aciculare CBS 342.82]|jgi:RNA polymerase-associated protein|uniref:Glutathione S-transferase n=1 Tax=Dissoconium aciculare CBS 342.82 TaxID=1314786 RepID=A0A6J3M988_9PEZI|nr:glutathione S-transferase [Dissoconium aciculare CBS 342.82]KAF1824580.1 glutathione S-transferase [Dissoconium aciculare CBS 342.82]